MRSYEQENAAYLFIVKGMLLLVIIVIAFMVGMSMNKQMEHHGALQAKVEAVNADVKAYLATRDSIAFETAAEYVTYIDFPEELPVTGDSMCARISNDTMYMEHYHGQVKMHKFVYNQ